MWRLLVVLAAPAHGACAAHTALNNSDVITTYAGHADAGPQQYRDVVINKGLRKESDRVGRYGERKGDRLRSELREEKKAETDNVDSDYMENTAVTEAPNGVVFVPSGNRERGMEGQSMKRRGGAKNQDSDTDMIERVAVGDIINERVRVTVSPDENGVFFKPGKNNEQTEQEIIHEQENKIMEKANKELKEVSENPIDCDNLDCEHIVESVCGVKLQNKKPKYRLFMNECYFRKVNCGLRYEYNRYMLVPLEDCNGVGSHISPSPEQPVGWLHYNEPKSLPARRSGGNRQIKTKGSSFRRNYNEIRNTKATQKYINQRKIERWPNGFKQDLLASQAGIKSNMMKYLARALRARAMTSNVVGLPCVHACPVRCPDEYAPVCADTYPELPRAFQNHCLLDLQACGDGLEWHERPLADCAGMVKAEVHERAAFIGWMQRMGILDKKGHLVM